MLTFHSNLSRRTFLTVGGLGAGGLCLADLLKVQTRGQAAKPARPKAVIMVLLEGGPSHLDLYDLKPNAPAEFRGEFKAIKTSVPGIDLSELLPLQAPLADKLTIVRGVKFAQNDHVLEEVLTGSAERRLRQGPGRPHIGSVVSYLLKGERQQHLLPRFVALDQRGDPSFLGPAHKPFVAEGPGLDNLSLATGSGIALEQLRERRALLQSFDTLRRDIDDRRGLMTELDIHKEQALDVLVSNQVRDAFDVTREPQAVRARYGNYTQFLTALRLAQAGVSFITLNDGINWDTHENNFAALRVKTPPLDMALSALIADLYARGLDRDVAVLVWGEFGREPRLTATPKNPVANGRNHWPDAGFVLFAGGGLRMGQIIGDSGPRGERDTTRSRPITPQNVLATLHHVLGLDARDMLTDSDGRPREYLWDTRPIDELL